MQVKYKKKRSTGGPGDISECDVGYGSMVHLFSVSENHIHFVF